MMHWLLAPQRAFWWWPFSFTFSGLWYHHCEGSEKNCCQSFSTILLWPAMNQGNHWNIIHPHGHCNQIVNASNVHPLDTSIWTIKSYLNTQEIAHYSSLLIQNTPIKFQSNFIRNTHKIKQLRLQYIQMVIHNYCIIGNKRGLLLKSLCCWGWTSQVICLLTSLYSLSYLRMGPAAPIKRFPPSEAPPALWHWTRSCHMHLTVSTSSEKKKLLEYPSLNSTCRWCCWHFCHQSIHQLIEFTSTRLHKRLHNNMVRVKIVPVPQPKQNKRQQESVQSWPCECQSQVTTKE
jgi:hypothetical protein